MEIPGVKIELVPQETLAFSSSRLGILKIGVPLTDQTPPPNHSKILIGRFQVEVVETVTTGRED